MQYKIPQNIGIEDKIVGPFSLRQLIIVAVGVGISYVLFAVSSKLYELNSIEYFVIALPAILSLALAFLKINGINFGKYIILMLEFSLKPKKRLWDHRGILNIVDPNLAAAPTPDSKKEKAKKEFDKQGNKAVNLSELTRVLDSGGFDNSKELTHEDIDRVRDDDLITQAFFGHRRAESPTENMYWRTTASQKKRLELLAKIPSQKKGAEKSVEEKSSVTIAEKEQPKKEEIVPAVVKTEPEVQEAPKNLEPSEPERKKKKRKRKKKPKQQPQLRPETQVSTIDKGEPAKYPEQNRPAPESGPEPELEPMPTPEPIPAPEPEPPKRSEATQPKKESSPRSGEIHMDELRKGSTIEFNLD